MTDLVVTVPRDIWTDWIDEGDAAGEPESGEQWGFFLGRCGVHPKPPIEPGERLYIVSHDRVRGYAPVNKVMAYEGRWAIGRKGGALAVTIGALVPGFRGFRKRWWSYDDEQPFPEWKTADLWLNRVARQPAAHAAKPGVGPRADGATMTACGRWVPAVSEIATCKSCLRGAPTLESDERIVVADERQIGMFG